MKIEQKTTVTNPIIGIILKSGKNSDLPEGEGERAEFKIVKRRENRICCVPS